MADVRLTTKNFLATPPADDDVGHIVDVSDLTADPAGTSFKQRIDVHRTHGDLQVTTYDNAGSIGPSAGEVHLDLTLASFFRVRSNAAVNLLNVANSGAVSIENNLSIISGDIIVSAGDIDVQAGDVDCENITSNGAGVNTFSGTIETSAIISLEMTGAVGQLVANNIMTITSQAGNMIITATAGEILLNPDTLIDFADSNLDNVTGIQIESGAVDPLITDIDDEHFQLWENTTAQMNTSAGLVNEIALWTNLDAVMQRSKPLNYEAAVSWSATVVEIGGAGTYLLGGGSVSIYDIDSNKAWLNINLTGITSNIAPTGGTFRVGNLPFAFIRESSMTVWTFDGGDQNFACIVGRVVNNGGNAEIEFVIQDVIDATFNSLLTGVTMAAGDLRLEGFMYI